MRDRRELTENVFIDVSENCSFCDREAFGRDMLVLIKLWEKLSYSVLLRTKFFMSQKERLLTTLHEIKGEHNTCRVLLTLPVSLTDLN